ncbi:MAG: HAD-IA family hydrolase [Clostridia bacterium]|nr:HAD-IA family hydrolase [Clostridia bacterium]
MYKTIVFDLDGTLLDTLDDLTSSTNAALAAFSLPQRTKAEVQSFVGNGIKNLIRRAIGAHDADLEAVLAAFRAHYQDHCEDLTKPYEGILDLLRALRARGAKLAVLSNKADFAVKRLADAYFYGLLDEAVGENEALGIRKKPAPDALYTVMEKLSASREETVYIGDSDVDIQTARNAGVDCISVTWGFRDERFLCENGATKLARTAEELLRMV